MVVVEEEEKPEEGRDAFPRVEVKFIKLWVTTFLDCIPINRSLMIELCRFTIVVS